MLKVVLVEDSREVRSALRSLLALIDGIKVVGAAADTATALRLIDDTGPDVIVLDVALHGRDRGIDVLRHVAEHHPRADVIVLSNHSWQAMRDGFLQAGARAYFDKSLQFREACDWIRERALRP